MKNIFTLLILIMTTFCLSNAQKINFQTKTTLSASGIPQGSTVYVTEYLKGFFKITWTGGTLGPIETWVVENKIVMTNELKHYRDSIQAILKIKETQDIKQ